jgi:hypothetical protein
VPRVVAVVVVEQLRSLSKNKSYHHKDFKKALREQASRQSQKDVHSRQD